MTTREPKPLQESERRRPAEGIDDDISASLPELTAEQLEEIERRLDDHIRDPGAAIPWQEVRAKLWSRLE